MKITKSQLKKIIKEELQKTLREYSDYSKEARDDWRARGGREPAPGEPGVEVAQAQYDQARAFRSRKSGGKKQAITANINKMYQDLRKYDKMFVKDQDLMRKYNKALEAVNALLRGIS